MVGLRRVRISAWAAAATMSGFLTLGAGGAAAQSVFCPASPGVATGPGDNPNFALATGRCTNGNSGTGAFSGAALGSQSLSDLASGSTETTNRASSGMVQERRQAEQESCPIGTVRRQGRCLPIPRAETRADPQLPARTRVPAAVRARSEARRAPMRASRRGPVAQPVDVGMYEKGPRAVVVPAFVQAYEGVRMGTFAQGFGDYEERSGRSGSSLLYLQPDPTTGASGGGPAVINPLQILSKSRSTSFGALGGIDFTSRGHLSADDGLIVGILGGYVESEVRVSSRILSLNPTLANNGSSTLTARSSGGSVGGFATYFDGPLSIDALYKADFLDLSERFIDNQAYSATFTYNGPGVPPTINPPQNALIFGTGKTSLVNHSIVANFNYRIPLASGFWMEPTAGLQARWVDYASSAALLGLADGHLFRLQAGSRFGWDLDYGWMRLTPVITGLAYSDVSVKGGFVDFGQNGSFGATSGSLGVSGTSPVNIRQEGLLRGQGIFTLIGEFNNGWSAFAQAEVRGGKDLFGVGGKGGIRYQW